jgi:apolipoprotein N-acyltransferase
MVNITNDGWFPGDENALQLQAAVFRCIENRAPMARSVNTGISGFIDSCGRLSHLLPVRTEGTSSCRLSLDDRLSPYTRWGDWFAWSCVIIACAMMAQATGRRYIKGIKT